MWLLLLESLFFPGTPSLVPVVESVPTSGEPSAAPSWALGELPGVSRLDSAVFSAPLGFQLLGLLSATHLISGLQNFVAMVCALILPDLVGFHFLKSFLKLFF